MATIAPAILTCANTVTTGAVFFFAFILFILFRMILRSFISSNVEGFRERFSVIPLRNLDDLYCAQKLLLTVFADKAAIADGLNPFTINQTAKTISKIAVGIIKRPIPDSINGAV